MGQIRLPWGLGPLSSSGQTKHLLCSERKGKERREEKRRGKGREEKGREEGTGGRGEDGREERRREKKRRGAERRGEERRKERYTHFKILGLHSFADVLQLGPQKETDLKA